MNQLEIENIQDLTLLVLHKFLFSNQLNFTIFQL